MAMYSNVNRMTGLSGIDTESMIKQIMLSESQKLYKLQKNNTLLTWKQEAYWSVADKLKTFQDKFLRASNGANSIMLPSNFNVLSAIAKINDQDTSAVSVSASSTAASGSHKLHILQLATKDTYTKKIKQVITGEFDETYITDPEKAITENDSFKLTLDGITKTISFTEAELSAINGAGSGNIAGKYKDTLNEKLKEAFGEKIGISADINGNKITIDVKEPGHTLTIADGNPRVSKADLEVLFSDDIAKSLQGKKFALNVEEDGTVKTVEIDFSKYNDDKPLTAKAAVSEINNALSLKGVSVSFYLEGDKLKAQTNGLTNSKIEISDGDGGFLNALGKTEALAFEKTSTLDKFGGFVSGSSNYVNDNMKVKDIFTNAFAGGSDSATFAINGKEIEINADDTLSQMINKISASGANVELTYSKLSGEISLVSKGTGSTSVIDMSEEAKAFFSVGEVGEDGDPIMKHTEALDAKFELDGILTSRSSNTFIIDGVTYTLKRETSTIDGGGNITGDPIEINVSKDTSKAKTLLEEFVKGYNELIESINGMVNEKKAKASKYSGYDPLTDDEKKELTENEIKLWEEKAKQGILYRDSILSDITSAMRNQLYQPVTLSDGTKLSLYELGITTTDKYSEQGKLEIDNTKIDAALEKYSDKITEFFTKSSDIVYGTKGKKQERLASEGMAERLNDILRDAIGTNGTISNKAGIKGSYTETNNALKKELEDSSQKISDMMTYLYEKENYYYQLFAKMEAAINKNNNQMASLQSMLGLA